jgi:hypothetical protein
VVRNAERRRGPTLHYKRPDDGVFGVGVRVDIRTCRTCALPDEGYAVGVTAENGDVVADPFNGYALVL